MTLQELYDQHPEWRALPLAVLRSDGTVVFVGPDAPGDVFPVDADADGGAVTVLAFDPD